LQKWKEGKQDIPFLPVFQVFGGFHAESVLELFAQPVLLAHLEQNSSCFTRSA